MPLSKTKKQGLSIGTIFDGIGETKDQLTLELDQLKKHVLVCGVTGSGKTNTCVGLIEEIMRSKTPFMVLESCKSEYRNLLVDPDKFPEAMIYTVGDETIVPLRLNPFEIIKGVKVLSHLEALKAVFNASFEMYAPMPQVLEKALILLYEQKGWDLSENRNLRLPSHMSLNEAPSQIFPTMKELYDLIEPVTLSFHYSDRIGPDVCAALQARIGSLLTGSKERIFSARRSIAPRILFERPTVVEFKELFSSEEKAFVSQILLLFLYEYRKAKGTSSKLQHVMFVEDAHRLLGSYQQSPRDESRASDNFRQIFRHIFSEIGAYGQSIVISTQCPGDLPPEILNNSNLRVIHRLSTNREVSAVSGAMSFNDTDRRLINSLAVGDALVYGENMDQPCRLRVPSRVSTYAADGVPPESSDEMVRTAMKRCDAGDTDKSSVYEKFLEGYDPSVRKSGNWVAGQATFKQTFNRYIMCTLGDPVQLVYFRANLIHEAQRLLGGRDRTTNLSAVTWCAIVEATDRYFDKKGEEHFWFYDEVLEQKNRWLNLLKVAFVPSDKKPQLPLNQVNKWREQLIEIQKQDQGPLLTCGPCESKCLYRYEVSEVIRDEKIKSDFNACINQADTPSSESAAWFCRLLSERLIGKFDIDLAYCLAAHLIKNHDLSTDAQMVLLHKVRTALASFDPTPERGEDSN